MNNKKCTICDSLVLVQRKTRCEICVISFKGLNDKQAKSHIIKMYEHMKSKGEL
jgi:hypothetical protein